MAYCIQVDKGTRYGRLRVIKETDRVLAGKQLQRAFKLRCDCGKTVVARLGHLRQGYIQSCGCLQIDRTVKANTTHGFTNHLLYDVYRGMLSRCHTRDAHDFYYYGGRGIKVFSAWRRDRAKFFTWARANGWQKGLQIDRKDNDGPYSPNNCRFVTQTVNQWNKRSNVLIRYKGEVMCIGELVGRFDRHNLGYDEVYNRIKRGWYPKHAIEAPLGSELISCLA